MDFNSTTTNCSTTLCTSIHAKYSTFTTLASFTDVILIVVLALLLPHLLAVSPPPLLSVLQLLLLASAMHLLFRCNDHIAVTVLFMCSQGSGSGLCMLTGTPAGCAINTDSPVFSHAWSSISGKDDIWIWSYPWCTFKNQWAAVQCELSVTNLPRFEVKCQQLVIKRSFFSDALCNTIMSWDLEPIHKMFIVTLQNVHCLHRHFGFVALWYKSKWHAYHCGELLKMMKAGFGM